MTDSDETLTRYLFGELPEPEQARLEERYFRDAQTFEHLARLEAELVDDYARGRLSPQVRERFERAYLARPDRRAHVRFGEALTARLDEIAAARAAERATEKHASWWQRLSASLAGGRRALAFSLALLLLLVSSVSVFLFIRGERLRRELARARDAQAAQEQSARAAQQQLADERARTQELNAEPVRAGVEPNPQPSPPARESPTTPAPASPTPGTSPRVAVASLVLTAGGARGVETGAPPSLVIHKETRQVRLRLELSENEYQDYQLVLQSVGGREVFSRRLKPSVSRRGASFGVTLPASSFAAGDYILTLKGATHGGQLEDVSQSLFRVERK
jgi:hypothetical protein